MKINPYRAMFWLVVAAMVLAGLVIAIPAEASILCKREAGNDAYYTWRYVEGKKCWYKGRKRVRKSVLSWDDPKRAMARLINRPVDNTGHRQPTVDTAVNNDLVPMMFAPILMHQDGIPEWLDHRVTHTMKGDRLR